MNTYFEYEEKDITYHCRSDRTAVELGSYAEQYCQNNNIRYVIK